MTTEADITVAVCGHTSRVGGWEPCTLAPEHTDQHEDVEGRTWFNYGPLETYEITWMSGHIETVAAHQVTYPHAGMVMASYLGLAAEGGAPRIRMHAELDGRWVLTLAAREEDIRTIRNVTGGERVPR